MARILIAAALVLAAGPAIADPVAGQKAFQSQCAICHAVVAGGKKIGPSLFGVVGRPSGSVPGFAYSKGMAAARLVWSASTLDTYLTAPAKLVHGTKMAFAGIGKPAQRSDVIDYLATLK